MSRFKHYLEVATGMQVANPEFANKEALQSPEVRLGTEKMNEMFNYYQKRLNNAYNSFLLKKENELKREKDEEKTQKIKETIMGIKGLGKRGLITQGYNEYSRSKHFRDLTPPEAIDDLQDAKTYSDFVKVISNLQRECNSRIKMIRDSTLAEIDKNGKKENVSEEIIRTQRSIILDLQSRLVRQTFDNK